MSPNSMGPNAAAGSSAHADALRDLPVTVRSGLVDELGLALSTTPTRIDVKPVADFGLCRRSAKQGRHE